MKPSKAAKEKNPNPAQPTRVKKSLRLQMPLLLSAAIVSSLRTHGQLIRKLQHQAMHQQKLRHGMAAYSKQENKHCHRIIERPKTEGVADRQDDTAKCLSLVESR